MLTACGIETIVQQGTMWTVFGGRLQQCLPLAVLKPSTNMIFLLSCRVATVLTACGIETVVTESNKIKKYGGCNSAYRLRYWNDRSISSLDIINTSCNSAYRLRYWNFHDVGCYTYSKCSLVATVLTACGIETKMLSFVLASAKALQQCLPLAVLKPRNEGRRLRGRPRAVATVLTACGLETDS